MSAILQMAPRLLVLLTAFGLAACGDEHQAETAGKPAAEPAGVTRIEGSVIYRERMLLPPGVEVEIQLQDISRADAMATVLASVLLTPQGSPPYNFALEYDPATIDSRLRYALRATISDGGRLLFTSTDYIDPFKGNPVEILVRKVPEVMVPGGPSLEGDTWVLETLAGEPALPGAGGKPVDIRFVATGNLAEGFSGCNRYTGGYLREGAVEQGSPLRFDPIAATMMACEDGAQLEHAYLQALDSVTAFSLDGNTLSLLAGPEVVATFRAP